MPEFDPLEAALARLMPTALSVSGQRSIDDALDELAADLPASRWQMWRRLAVGCGIAATVVIGSSIAWTMLRPVVAHPIQTVADIPSIEWLGKSDRVESMFDEGRMSGTEGDALHAVRLRVVEEKTLRDRETGYTLNVSEPRDELLLMPVSNF